MNYRIWKYELSVTDMQRVMMPPGAELLSVANQGGTLCLWAKVDADLPPTDEVWIEIIGTGNEIPTDMGIDRNFIGTVLQNPFVWHVFERV